MSVQPMRLITPPANWQPPLGFQEAPLPTYSQLGVAGTVDDVAIELRPASSTPHATTPQIIAKAETENAAIHAAAKRSQPIQGWNELTTTHRESLVGQMMGGTTYQKHAGWQPVGVSESRLPHLIVESPWKGQPNSGGNYFVVPTTSTRAGAAAENIGMPPVGTSLIGGHVYPDRFGSFREGYELLEPAKGRVVAITDGARIARFAEGSDTALVEALDPSALRSGWGRRGAIAAAAGIGVAAAAAVYAWRHDK